jgi:hypothetical protein
MSITMSDPTTGVALIVLALDAGAIWATLLVMINVWFNHRASRLSSRGVHRAGAVRPPRTVRLGAHPDALAALDRDLTPRLPDPSRYPTVVLAAPVDPWAGADKCADYVLALAA